MAEGRISIHCYMAEGPVQCLYSAGTDAGRGSLETTGNKSV